MKSYTIRLNNAQHTVLATSPRKALWLAIKCHAIPSSAWKFMKEHKLEGFYGPLSIFKNQANQMILPLSQSKE